MEFLNRFKKWFSNLNGDMKKHFIILLIANTLSISGIFIQTHGILGIIGLSMIIYSSYRYSTIHLTNWKFYRRKLTKHKIWVNVEYRGYLKWSPLGESFYVPSDECSGCYIVNPKEVLEYYSDCVSSSHLISMIESYEKLPNININEIYGDLFSHVLDSKYIISYDINKEIYRIGNRENTVNELLEK